MSLPILKNEQKIIKIKVPSTKSVGIRAWKVKEEKELLFACESTDDKDQKEQLIMQFIENCTDTPNTNFSHSDLKKIAAELRKVSKGETIDFSCKCPHCDRKNTQELDLNKDTIEKQFDVSPAIINKDLTISFKEIDYQTLLKIKEQYKENKAKYNFYIILHSIEAITYKKEVFPNFTIDELEDFLDEFSFPNFLEILHKELVKRSSYYGINKKILCMFCNKEFIIEPGNLLSFLVL